MLKCAKMSLDNNQNTPKIMVRKIEFRTHAHATESIDKVTDTLLLLTSASISKKDMKFGNLSGTYGQRITTIKFILENQKEIDGFITNLSQNLPINDKKKLKLEFAQRLNDKYKLYIRLDKQEAALGNMVLAKTSDVIQVIFSNYNKTPAIKMNLNNLTELYRSLRII